MKPQDLPEHAARAPHAEAERRYGRVLALCTWGGTALLLFSFLADVTGLLPARAPHEALPRLWMLSAARYVEATDWPTGWRWLTGLGQGDVAGLLGIAVLCAASGVCLLALVPGYLRQRDRLYAGLCVAGAAVLAAAASGVFTAGR